MRLKGMLPTEEQVIQGRISSQSPSPVRIDRDIPHSLANSSSRDRCRREVWGTDSFAPVSPDLVLLDQDFRAWAKRSMPSAWSNDVGDDHVGDVFRLQSDLRDGQRRNKFSPSSLKKTARG